MSSGSAALGRMHSHPIADGPRIDKAAIAEVVHGVIASLRGDLSAKDVSFLSELEALVDFIRSAKTEIASLCPTEIQEKHLPIATDELDAIVGATEEATHVILDSVEKIEAATASLAQENKAAVGEAITRIYEACNFQDITGQRVTKVVRTLREIETKIAALVRAFGSEARAAAEGKTDTAADRGSEETSLLNGPQLPGTANTQADIDALFGSD